jgi:hypothetical protein
MPGQRQRPRRCQADYASPDDDRLDLVHCLSPKVMTPTSGVII